MSEELIFIDEEKELDELRELIELKELSKADQIKTVKNLFKQIQVKKLSEKKEKEEMKKNDLMKEIAIDKVGNEILGTNGIADMEGLKDYTTGNLLDIAEGVKKLNELMSDFKQYEKGMKAEETKEDFTEVFEEVSMEVWESYFIGRFASYGCNEPITVQNIETAFNFHQVIKGIEFDIWSISNPPNKKLLDRGVSLGLTPEKGETFKSFKRKCDLKEYPMNEGQKTSYKNLLKAKGMKAKEIMSEMKIERTYHEARIIIDQLKEIVPPTEGHISYINGLQIKLGLQCSTPTNRKQAQEFADTLKLKYALHLGASFGSIQELKEYADKEAKINKCYANQIIDGIIKGLEADRVTNYFKSEEVQSDLQRRIAHTLGRK